MVPGCVPFKAVGRHPRYNVAMLFSAEMFERQVSRGGLAGLYAVVSTLAAKRRGVSAIIGGMPPSCLD